MPRVPVESFTLATHTLVPVLPDQPGVNADGLRDTCSTCHTGLTPAAMQQFVTNSQNNTRRRLDAATTALRVNTPGWVRTALDFIEGDGSLGVHNHRYTAALLDAVEIELGLVASRSPLMAAIRPVQNPAACAECHQNEHREWLTSPHAQASLSDVFRQEFAQLRQPTYCMGCHASGYNPQTGEYLFEGVTCSSCHYTEGDFEHPPAPVVVASNSSACGVCHSGAHAPTYDEWLVGAHSRSGIDCVDCHTPHDNGLRQGDVNTTCGNCHQEALVDPVHMGEDLDCTDCHMKRELDASGVHVIRTGHSMLIDPGTCAECHGSVHLLSAVRSSDGLLSAREEVASLHEEVERLRIEAQNSTTMGILGGALGVLVIVSIGLIILRRFK